MKISAIRGATTAQSNSKEHIKAATLELYQQILLKNNLRQKDIVFIIASSTADLTQYYPATAIRLSGCDRPLFSCTEPSIADALPLCIRLIVLTKKKRATHIYLNQAKDLRS